jgi:hypothetical protein
MATVENVLVTVDGIPPFRPTAMSRIGFDLE